MKHHTDRDGKSKTASAVNGGDHPEQHEVHEHDFGESSSHRKIAQRAYELWQQRGCPEGSAEQDWLEACDELRASRVSAEARSASGESGSVQH
jgi:hypothetical protein